MKLHTILHPTDFSAPSEYAFQLACALARDYGAKVIALHVIPPPVSHGEEVARRQGEGYHKEMQRMLNRIQAPDQSVNVRHLLEDGPPAEAILRVARDESCDLIVMGSHGRSGLRRLLMGSVAEAVLRGAACPVLTVKGPMPPGSQASGAE